MNKKSIDRILVEDSALIDKAITDAAKAARLKHKKLGHPIIVMRNGKLVRVPPDEIDV